MITQKTLTDFVTSKPFKVIFLILSILFLIATFFITVQPETFIGYGYLGIFVFNVISSGLLLMPALVSKFDLILLVLVSSLGNIPNTTINYLIGSSGKSFLVHLSWMTTVKRWMRKFETPLIYAFAIFPFPIDVNGLLCGYLGVSYKKYILINFLGKITIFLLVGLGIISVSILL